MGARPVEGLIVDHKSCGCRSSRLRIKWREPGLGADYLMHKVAMSRVDWSALREDFPILRERVNGHPLIYFDNAATSQKPRAVLDVVRSYYEHENANVHRGLHALSARATESINLVAQAWGGKFLRAGDVILLTEMEHHSNLVPWQLLSERIGAQLRFVPVHDDGTLALEKLSSLLTPEVKMFAFTHVSNSLGTINPVVDLCQKARAVGAVTLVDAAQSIGHMPLNVQELGCDFLAFSGHKMCAPTGIGVLYARSEIFKSIPPWHGGGEMITSVTLEKSSFKQPPHRFEAGTPNIAGAIGLAAAIDYIEGIGRAQIFQHDVDFATYALKRMAEVPGLRVLGTAQERGGVISFVMDAAHPHDLTTFADRYGLALRGGHHCNQPLMRRFGVTGTSRASFYFYNTREEIDRTIDILQKAVGFFK